MAKRSWVVKASRQKLPLDLPGEEWVEVKSHLTTGESRRVRYAGLGRMKAPPRGETPELQIDWEDAETVRILTWCTDWSFVDANEKPLPLNLETLNSIDDEAFNAVKGALDAYIEEMQQEKKATSGESGKSRLKQISA